ncbi:MAG: hypothetical protein AB7G06_06095 [Bdellovibrionales bacterium]
MIRAIHNAYARAVFRKNLLAFANAEPAKSPFSWTKIPAMLVASVGAKFLAYSAINPTGNINADNTAKLIGISLILLGGSVLLGHKVIDKELGRLRGLDNNINASDVNPEKQPVLHALQCASRIGNAHFMLTLLEQDTPLKDPDKLKQQSTDTLTAAMADPLFGKLYSNLRRTHAKALGIV